MGFLNQIDIRVRKFVREALHLPHDTPRAYFHARVCDGDLGVLNFRLSWLLSRCNRLNSFMKDFGLIDRNMLNFYSSIFAKIESFLYYEEVHFNSKFLIDEYFRRKLINSNDGKDLELARFVPSQNNWLVSTNAFIKGRDFIHFAKLRVNALPSRVRVSRGDQRAKLCSACHSKTETTYHIIQSCPRTHGLRVKRHGNIVKHIAGLNEKRNKTVVIEPRIQTNEGLRKPDLIIKDGAHATIVDIQVVGNDGNNLKTFNNNKFNYYNKNSDLKNYIKSYYNVAEVDVVAVALHYKGFACLQSFNWAAEFDIIRKVI